VTRSLAIPQASAWLCKAGEDGLDVPLRRGSEGESWMWHAGRLRAVVPEEVDSGLSRERVNPEPWIGSSTSPEKA